MRVDELGEIGRILESTALRGRAVDLVAAEPTGSARLIEASRKLEVAPVFVVPCRSDEIEACVLEARSVVGQSGRWPVGATGWEISGLAVQLVLEVWPLTEIPESLDDAQIDAVVGDRNAARDRHRFDDHWAEVRAEIRQTASFCGSAPSEDEIRAAFGPCPGIGELDVWLFDWEQDKTGGSSLPPTGDQRDQWFEPAGQPCGVVLTPTASPTLGAGSMRFFGAERLSDLPFFLALLERWYERWGARLVSCFGTMLAFDVERPPSGPEDVMALALEHLSIAPCTTVLSGEAIRTYARRLAGAEHWFLHERP